MLASSFNAVRPLSMMIAVMPAEKRLFLEAIQIRDSAIQCEAGTHMLTLPERRPGDVQRARLRLLGGR